MEKTIIIDGKPVLFKSTGAIPLRYRAQFGRDFYADLVSIIGKKEWKKVKNKSFNEDDIDITEINFETFYNIAWTFAKTGNKEIPPPMEWLDSFDEFPMFEILPELQDMLTKTLQGKKK